MSIGQERIEEIDIIRGFATMLMILGHSFIVYPIDISGGIIQKWIYTFHMEMFFVVAGMVYKCSSYKKYIKKKVKRIIVPYFLFGCLSLILHIVGGSAVNGSTNLLDGIKKLVFYGGDYWFLYTLFIIYAIFPVILYCFSTVKSEIFFCICVVVIGTIIDSPNVFTISNIMYYLPFFLLGYLFSKRKVKFENIRLAFLLLILYGVLEYMLSLFKIELTNIIKTLIAMTMIISIFIFASKLSNIKEIKSIKYIKKLLTECSKYSLQMYLFNGYFLVVFRILICNLLHVVSPLIIVLGIFWGNILMILFVCKYIISRNKFFMKICGM